MIFCQYTTSQSESLLRIVKYQKLQKNVLPDVPFWVSPEDVKSFFFSKG